MVKSSEQFILTWKVLKLISRVFSQRSICDNSDVIDVLEFSSTPFWNFLVRSSFNNNGTTAGPGCTN